MKGDRQAARRREIEEAAFELVVEKGYAAATMLGVAKRAGASNETLYKWYGDKIGLMRALVAANADTAGRLLDEAIADRTDALDALLPIGEALLRLVTGERAIALNRAAAAEAARDPSLGAAIAASGRDAVAPRLAQLFAPRLGDGARPAVEAYLALLIGDLQIRRAIGALEPLDDGEIARRAAAARDGLRALYPALEAEPR